MAFENDSDTALKTGNPIFLMTTSIKNIYKPSHQPKLITVNVEKSTVKGSADRLNFSLDDRAKSESDNPEIGNKYYLSMELENGSYAIRGLSCMSSGFLVIGSYFVPIHADLDAAGPGIFYLGHVSATLRQRQGDEFKAGPSIPLIDQAVVGASGGTFDIEISDQWEKDESAFRSKFRALATTEITKAILAPFDREKAQQWWQDH